MNDRDYVIESIRQAFRDVKYPGDDFLLGSREGCEPFEEIEPFKGQQDWTKIKSDLLDERYTALNFFSEAGLRFFLPAFLIADLNDELQTADPMFILVNGFNNLSIEHQIEKRVFVRNTGKNAFINPRRYGAMTFYDYSCYRLSIFTREESQAIVRYLKYKQENDPYGLNNKQIGAALNSFWLERATHAPTAESIILHLLEEEEYLSAIGSQFSGSS